MDFIKRKLKFITDQLNILEPYEKTIQDIRKDYNVYLIWSKRNINVIIQLYKEYIEDFIAIANGNFNLKDFYVTKLQKGIKDKNYENISKNYFNDIASFFCLLCLLMPRRPCGTIKFSSHYTLSTRTIFRSWPVQLRSIGNC